MLFKPIMNNIFCIKLLHVKNYYRDMKKENILELTA